MDFGVLYTGRVNMRRSISSNMLAGNDGQKKFAFCREEHIAEKCTKIKDGQERKRCLIKSARYLSCLEPGNRPHKCRIKVNYNLCKGNHHCAICPTLATSAPRLLPRPVRTSSHSLLNPHWTPPLQHGWGTPAPKGGWPCKQP